MKKLLLSTLAISTHCMQSVQVQSGSSCSVSWQDLKDQIEQLKREAHDLVDQAKERAFLAGKNYTVAVRAVDNAPAGPYAMMLKDAEEEHHNARVAFDKAVRAAREADKLSVTWSFFKKRLQERIDSVKDLLVEARKA